MSVVTVAYLRMSDLRQENSIDRQRSQIEAYAAKNGYTISREYIDEGISGDQILKRKEFQRMLRDAQAGQFECILCDDKDRFGRFDSIDLGEIVAPLRRKGVWVETAAQGRIDWESMAGRMSDSIMQEAKLIEQAAISRRVLSGQMQRAKEGKDTGGRRTYGYRWEVGFEQKKRFVPDGFKAEVVKLIFQLYDDGRTLFQIVEELHRRCILSPTGRERWTRSVLQRLLRKRRYVGDWTWGVNPSGKRHRVQGNGLRETRRNEKAQIRNPEEGWTIVRDHHEALIDREQFERVQARLNKNQEHAVPRARDGKFALSRLLVCGHCGSFLIGVTVRGQRAYVCRGYLAYGKDYCNRNQVKEEPLLRHLARILQKEFLDPERLKALRKEVSEQQEKLRCGEERKKVMARIAKLDRRIELGYEKLFDLPKDLVAGVGEAIKRCELERADLKESLKCVDSRRPVRNLEEEITLVNGALWRLTDAITKADPHLVRDALREFIVQVKLKWVHKKCDKTTRARVHSGVVALRPIEGVCLTDPLAGQ